MAIRCMSTADRPRPGATSCRGRGTGPSMAGGRGQMSTTEPFAEAFFACRVHNAPDPVGISEWTIHGNELFGVFVRQAQRMRFVERTVRTNCTGSLCPRRSVPSDREGEGNEAPRRSPPTSSSSQILGDQQHQPGIPGGRPQQVNRIWISALAAGFSAAPIVCLNICCGLHKEAGYDNRRQTPKLANSQNRTGLVRLPCRPQGWLPLGREVW